MVDLDQILESVIDPTRTDLDQKIFDKSDGYILKSYIRKQLRDIIKEIDRDIIKVNKSYIKGIRNRL